MGSLSNAKILGGVGAILSLVGLGFIGFILKLVAVKQISDATGNKEIFNKYLWAGNSQHNRWDSALRLVLHATHDRKP